MFAGGYAVIGEGHSRQAGHVGLFKASAGRYQETEPRIAQQTPGIDEYLPVTVLLKHVQLPQNSNCF